MKIKNNLQLITKLFLVLIESFTLLLPLWMTDLYIIYIGNIKNQLLNNNLSREINYILQSSILGLLLVFLWIITLTYFISDLKKLIFNLSKRMK